MKHGGYWRLATFSDHYTAGYRLQSVEKPHVLDHIIDSACMAKRSPIDDKSSHVLSDMWFDNSALEVAG